MEKIVHFKTLRTCDVITTGIVKQIEQLTTQYASVPHYLRNRPLAKLPIGKLVPEVAKITSEEVEYEDIVYYIASHNGIFPNLEGIKIFIDNFDLKSVIGIGRMYGFDEVSKLWNPLMKLDPPLLIPWIANYHEELMFGLSAFGKKNARVKRTGSYILYFKTVT